MAFTRALNLPHEILSIICDELGGTNDFATLYNCSLSSRSLAEPAMRFLYQYHEFSPAFEQNDEDNIRQSGNTLKEKRKQAERSVQKWAILWHSIVASSLDNVTTYKPYCRYLKTLDFRNLVQMLEEPRFTGSIRRDFFKKGLEEFNFTSQHNFRTAIDMIATVNAIGDAVVPKTFQLEEISGNLMPGVLTKWITHTPKLKSIVLFQGETLVDGTGQAIAQHCEDFRSLTVREWVATDADEKFALFLTELKPDTLQYFEMISTNTLQQQSFRALGLHGGLQDLRLNNLYNPAICLDALSGCTKLHTLVLEDNSGTTVLSSDSEIFTNIVTWLSSCESLRDLTIKRFFDGPAILAQVISSPQVRLRKLSVEGYHLRHPTSAAFHSALAEQRQLVSLSLKGNSDDASSDDLSIMVEALCHLTNLRELTLRDISDEFEESHIISLALELNQLEEFWTSGSEISEDVLMMLASMKNLKILTLLATTKFRAYSILDFIYKLDQEKQRGFVLSLMAQDSDYALSDVEQEFIRSEIEKNVDGQFEYALWRDPESDVSDSD